MDHTFKIVLIGGASVGKSAIFKRYMEGGFEKNAQSTISANYLEKQVEVPGKDHKLKIQLWDTAGHERFKTINRIYYRDASAALIVYDITRRDTLTAEAEHWLKDVKANAPTHCIIGLAGNKVDLAATREQQTSRQDLIDFATKNGI